MACHDGMTLMDLVSYNRKNNWANGEENNDGIDENLSWNSGIEGETDDQSIILFRKQRIKNFLSVLFLSTGVPMILSGDEVGKSQKGNNNVYCQDNDLAWFDWSLVDRNADLLRFTQKIIEFRRNCSNLRRSYFYLGNINERGLADISWHGCQLNSPGWYDDNSRVLAFTIASFVDSDPDIHVMMNMDSQNLDFEIPNIEDRKWYRFVDSSLDSPNDILSKNNVKLCKEKLYNVNSYSIAILISK
jgi:glycogen operon protein